MRLVHWQVREASEGIILPAEPEALRRHLERRQAQGIRLNVNVLGEAILGEEEADRRLDGPSSSMLRRPDVDYVSVKVSAICAQLSVLAFDDDGRPHRRAPAPAVRAAAATSRRPCS